jgi:hypothetical protein|tara:strand:+ start:873 stop:1538 length:666 start_codon:yes stop_codon:yes gene_type:complete
LKILLKYFSIIFILFIIIAIISHELIVKKIIENILTKLTEKTIIIEETEIDLENSIINFYNIKIKNDKNFHYKNLLICEEITIDFDLKSIFSKTLTLNTLTIKKPNFYVEINDYKESRKDNLNIIEKIKPDYKSKTYPPKKKDKDFIINNVELLSPKANFKFLNIYEHSNFKLSDMFFSNVGNSTGNSQHYKDVFKIFLLDMYLRIPDFEIRKKIKEIYKL